MAHSGSFNPIEEHRIEAILPSMYYIPNFITADEEISILRNIPESRWVSLSHRRVQAVPSRLTAKNALLASPMPKWLTHPMLCRFDSLGLFKDAPHGVNHCLINEYLPGQGIMAHEDGAAYHPVVATLSLGGTIVLDVTEKVPVAADGEVVDARTLPKKKVWRVLQEPRSLLVTMDSAYTDTLHGIGDVAEDFDLNQYSIANWKLLGDPAVIEANGGRNKREKRISLTYRDVKKVSTIGSKLFGKA